MVPIDWPHLSSSAVSVAPFIVDDHHELLLLLLMMLLLMMMMMLLLAMTRMIAFVVKLLIVHFISVLPSPMPPHCAQSIDGTIAQ
jgi:uncharacterized membrane protein YccC